MPYISNTNLILFFFIPPALVIGRGVSDTLISIISMAFLINLFYEKKFHIFKHSITYFFFIFFFYILLRGFFSSHPFESLFFNEGTIFYFRFYVFASSFTYFFLINDNFNKIKIFHKICISILILVTIDGYIQFFFGQNLLGFQKPYEIRLSGFFNQEAIIGIFLSKLLLIILIINSFINKDYKFSLFFIFLIILTILLIFLSGERGSFLLTLMFISCYFILFERKKYFIILVFSALCLIVISYFFSEDVAQRVQQTINEYKLNTIKFLPYTPHHEVHYITSIKMFFGNIFLVKVLVCSEKYVILKASHIQIIYFHLLAQLILIIFIFNY